MKFGWYDMLMINHGNRFLILFFCTAAVCKFTHVAIVYEQLWE